MLFCFANEEDEDQLSELIEACLQKKVNCIYCAGEIAWKTKLSFDIEIVGNWESDIKSKAYSPYGSASTNFDKEFWNASSLTYDPYWKLDKIVCLNLNKAGIRQHLKELITKIDDPDWLPSEEEVLFPTYDSTS